MSTSWIEEKLTLLRLNLDFRRDVRLASLGEVYRHHRTGHRRQSRNALVCSRDLRVVRVAEKHLRLGFRLDRDRLCGSVDFHQLSARDAGRLLLLTSASAFLCEDGDRSCNEQNSGKDNQRALDV